jgi:hypothetical protein
MFLYNLFQIQSHESMIDLISLLNELVDAQGKILIPGIYDDVLQLSENERKLYENIDFDQARIMIGTFFLSILRLSFFFKENIFR